MEKLYTANEVAKILGVSIRTVRQYLKDKKLSHKRIGNKIVRISESQLQEFINGGVSNGKGK